MKKQSYLLSALATALVAVDHVKACTDLIITAVFDAPTGARGIELYAPCDIPDLSKYGIGRVEGGANSNGQEFKFPAGTHVAAGSFVYVANNAGLFTTFMFDFPDYTVSTTADNDGDDVLELFRDEVVIDRYGVMGATGATDGTGTAWDFTDGWAYRKDNSKPTSTFTESQWDFSGKDALDGYPTNNFFDPWSWKWRYGVPDGSFTCNVDLCNTAAPSNVPSDTPSTSPSISAAPSESPSTSIVPSASPSISAAPSGSPSTSSAPSASPSFSAAPSESPSTSIAPSTSPSASVAPTKSPKATKAPASTKAPTATKAPSVNVRK